MTNESFIRPEELWQEVGLRAQQTIVHFGAGAGYYLIPAARIVGPQGKAIGIDVRSDMLAEIENRARRDGVDNIVRTVRTDLETEQGSSLPDNSADWVLVVNILHQADPAKLFREAARVAAANGHIVVVEWDSKATPFGPPADKRVSKAQAIEILQSLGLTVTREFTPSPYHYGLIV